jgi:hypothetical protein
MIAFTSVIGRWARRSKNDWRHISPVSGKIAITDLQTGGNHLF